MKTTFPPEALVDPAMASSERVIRKCVHCGFCTATCPTYVLLGDELDSPRGRIYLIKEMLENRRKPTPRVVKHIDRCLSCLACMTTCPSDVNYMHLIDHARAYVEEEYRRPFHERWARQILAAVLPHPWRFRVALALARLAKPAAPLIGRVAALRPLAAMLTLAPSRAERPAREAGIGRPGSRGRVALLQGCVEPVLRPQIREAAVRLLSRAGFEVAPIEGEACCGALVHHLGKQQSALEAARRNVDAWAAEIDGAGLAAIVTTASGCGTAIKDYDFLLRHDPAYADKAARVSALARDATEFLSECGLPPASSGPLKVAYHPACSLQHGQRVTDEPVALLAAAGFDVVLPRDAHLCCGSAGTYNILQADIADELGARKTTALDCLGADVIATGNIGCATQIGARSATPVLHIVELLDWATGGPPPAAVKRLADRRPS